MLLLGCERPPDRIPQWKIEKHRAWRIAGRENIVRGSHAYRGCAEGFQMSRYQTHGLMADRSHWDQQHHIYFLLGKLLSEGRRQFIPDLSLRVNTAHTGKNIRGNFADPAFALQAQ